MHGGVNAARWVLEGSLAPHYPSSDVSPPVVVISDVFGIELNIVFMQTVGTIENRK